MISDKFICWTAKPSLDWNMRKRIALGAARGLVYLHEQCDPKIIHRDVKAANVLLDDYCEAIVGDFGLAKLMDHTDSHVTTAVRGTVGHIAPEYLSTGQSSEKTDVFGFGILLLELISGHTALDFGNKAATPKGAMLDWVCISNFSILLAVVKNAIPCCPLSSIFHMFKENFRKFRLLYSLSKSWCTKKHRLLVNSMAVLSSVLELCTEWLECTTIGIMKDK